LQEAGDSVEDIAALLSVPVAKVERWADMTVVVVGKRGKKKLRHSEPVKRGLEHIAGQEVPEEQYKAHAERDRGVPARNMAQSLTRWLANGWVDDDPRTESALRELATELNEYLNAKENTA
jgi:hypothetical protein